MADELTHPYSIPFYRGFYRGSDDGNKTTEAERRGGTSNIFHPEELDASGSKQPIHGESLQGGSIGLDDLIEETGGGYLDPELETLAREHQKYLGSGGDLSFSNWLNSQDEERPASRDLSYRGLIEKNRRSYLKRIDLDEVDPKNDLVLQRKKLEMVWDDPQAVVTLKFEKNPSGEDDKLIIESSRLATPDGRSGIVEIKVRHLNGVMEKQGISRLIREPRILKGVTGPTELSSRDAEAVLEPLHSLRISIKKGPFQGNRLFAERYTREPRKSGFKENEGRLSINLELQKEKIDDLPKNEKDEARFFMGVWKNHDRDKILSFDVVVEGRKLSKLRIRYKGVEDNEDSVEISAETLSKICDGVRPFTGGNGGFVGLKFGPNKDQWILPQTSQGQIKEIVSKISIDGIKLGDVQINEVVVEEKRANVETKVVESPNLTINNEVLGFKSERVQREFDSFMKIWESGKVFEITLGVKGLDLFCMVITQEGGNKSASVTIGDLCDVLGAEKVAGGIKFSSQLSITGTDKNTGKARYVLGKLKIEGKSLNDKFITNFVELRDFDPKEEKTQ